MNPRPEKALFEEAAALKGMAVSFLEKDLIHPAALPLIYQDTSNRNPLHNVVSTP